MKSANQVLQYINTQRFYVSFASNPSNNSEKLRTFLAHLCLKKDNFLWKV